MDGYAEQIEHVPVKDEILEEPVKIEEATTEMSNAGKAAVGGELNPDEDISSKSELVGDDVSLISVKSDEASSDFTDEDKRVLNHKSQEDKKKLMEEGDSLSDDNEGSGVSDKRVITTEEIVGPTKDENEFVNHNAPDKELSVNGGGKHVVASDDKSNNDYINNDTIAENSVKTSEPNEQKNVEEVLQTLDVISKGTDATKSETEHLMKDHDQLKEVQVPIYDTMIKETISGKIDDEKQRFSKRLESPRESMDGGPRDDDQPVDDDENLAKREVSLQDVAESHRETQDAEMDDTLPSVNVMNKFDKISNSTTKNIANDAAAIETDHDSTVERKKISKSVSNDATKEIGNAFAETSENVDGCSEQVNENAPIKDKILEEPSSKTVKTADKVTEEMSIPEEEAIDNDSTHENFSNQPESVGDHKSPISVKSDETPSNVVEEDEVVVHHKSQEDEKKFEEKDALSSNYDEVSEVSEESVIGSEGTEAAAKAHQTQMKGNEPVNQTASDKELFRNDENERTLALDGKNNSGRTNDANAVETTVKPSEPTETNMREVAQKVNIEGKDSNATKNDTENSMENYDQLKGLQLPVLDTTVKEAVSDKLDDEKQVLVKKLESPLGTIDDRSRDTDQTVDNDEHLPERDVSLQDVAKSHRETQDAEVDDTVPSVNVKNEFDEMPSKATKDIANGDNNIKIDHNSTVGSPSEQQSKNNAPESLSILVKESFDDATKEIVNSFAETREDVDGYAEQLNENVQVKQEILERSVESGEVAHKITKEMPNPAQKVVDNDFTDEDLTIEPESVKPDENSNYFGKNSMDDVAEKDKLVFDHESHGDEKKSLEEDAISSDYDKESEMSGESVNDTEETDATAEDYQIHLKESELVNQNAPAEEMFGNNDDDDELAIDGRSNDDSMNNFNFKENEVKASATSDEQKNVEEAVHKSNIVPVVNKGSEATSENKWKDGKTSQEEDALSNDNDKSSKVTEESVIAAEDDAAAKDNRIHSKENEPLDQNAPDEKSYRNDESKQRALAFVRTIDTDNVNDASVKEKSVKTSATNEQKNVEEVQKLDTVTEGLEQTESETEHSIKDNDQLKEVHLPLNDSMVKEVITDEISDGEQVDARKLDSPPESTDDEPRHEDQTLDDNVKLGLVDSFQNASISLVEVQDIKKFDTASSNEVSNDKNAHDIAEKKQVNEQPIEAEDGQILMNQHDNLSSTETQKSVGGKDTNSNNKRFYALLREKLSNLIKESTSLRERNSRVANKTFEMVSVLRNELSNSLHEMKILKDSLNVSSYKSIVREGREVKSTFTEIEHASEGLRIKEQSYQPSEISANEVKEEDVRLVLRKIAAEIKDLKDVQIQLYEIGSKLEKLKLDLKNFKLKLAKLKAEINSFSKLAQSLQSEVQDQIVTDDMALIATENDAKDMLQKLKNLEDQLKSRDFESRGFINVLQEEARVLKSRLVNLEEEVLSKKRIESEYKMLINRKEGQLLEKVFRLEAELKRRKKNEVALHAAQREARSLKQKFASLNKQVEDVIRLRDAELVKRLQLLEDELISRKSNESRMLQQAQSETVKVLQKIAALEEDLKRNQVGSAAVDMMEVEKIKNQLKALENDLQSRLKVDEEQSNTSLKQEKVREIDFINEKLKVMSEREKSTVETAEITHKLLERVNTLEKQLAETEQSKSAGTVNKGELLATLKEQMKDNEDALKEMWEMMVSKQKCSLEEKSSPATPVENFGLPSDAHDTSKFCDKIGAGR